MTTNLAMRPAGETAKSLPRKMRFTGASLAAVRPPAVGRVTVYDDKTPGLAYTVTSRNARSFYLVARINGRPNRLRLRNALTVDQARVEARRQLGAMANGIDPAEERRRQRRAGTVGELWEGYLRDHLEPRATPKTIETDKSRFETCLKDWAGRKALDVLPSDVRTLHREIGAERGHVTANRAVQLVRRLYNFGKLGYNPVGRGDVSMFRETSRTRFLSPDELGRFLKALSHIEINPVIADIIRLSLFTGCRRANAQAARTKEFDLDAGVWTIPASKSKNAEPMVLPLVPQAQEIVKRRVGHPSGWLFPSHSVSGHVIEPKATWAKILKLAKLYDLHFHDCRRSFASWMAAGGTNILTIGKALGHRNISATQVYSRLDLTAVQRAAVGAVDAMLATVKGEQ